MPVQEMRKETTLRIVRRPSLSFKALCATFIGTFGILWLLVEPLPSLGIVPALLSSTGWWVYACLVVLACIFTALIEYSNHIRLLGKMHFVSLIIILTEDGTRNPVEAPQDMSIEKFIDLLFDKLSKKASRGTALSRADMYEKTLLVYRDGSYREVDGQMTIQEAGLVNYDLCKIRGRIRPVYTQVCFNSAGATAAEIRRQVESIRKCDEIYNQFASIAAKLAETEKGQRILVEYRHAQEYRKEWEDAGLPDPRLAKEFESEWNRLRYPAPWDNPKIF